MKFLLYRGRHGEQVLMEHTRENWDALMEEMIATDGCTPEEARRDGCWVDGGTFEEGYVSVDDGGKIFTVELSTDLEEGRRDF